MENGDIGTNTNCTKYLNNPKSFKQLNLQDLCDWDTHLQHTNSTLAEN
jgi:hypothetical protein